MLLQTFRDFYNIYISRDFLLISYPKSGSTLLRFALLNYFKLKAGDTPNLSHTYLNAHMPEIFQRTPRAASYFPIYKSHHIFPFRNKRMLLALRNPFDSLCSYYAFSQKRNPLKYPSIDSFLRANEGIKAYRKKLDRIVHLHQKHPFENYVVFYEDFIENPKTILIRVLLFIDPSNQSVDTIADELIDLLNRKNMREWEEREDNSQLKGFSAQKNHDDLRRQISPDLAEIIEQLDVEYHQCRHQFLSSL